MAVLSKYNWIIALTTIAFCLSALANGANDVANSYATSIAAQSLTMVQVGLLSLVTELIGAIALGSRVIATIKDNIISLDSFENNPAIFILAMGCAEVASATWLIVATRIGYSVSTTQTIVGALVGVGIATGSEISIEWKSGSVSQILASWAVAPVISGLISAVLMFFLKITVVRRDNPLSRAIVAMPVILSLTASILALFIVIEAPVTGSLEELGAGKGCTIVFGTLVGSLTIAYVFFRPFIIRRLLKEDKRIRFWHIILGPFLYMENPPLFWPGNKDVELVPDYYKGLRDTKAQLGIGDSGVNDGRVDGTGKSLPHLSWNQH